MMLSFLKNHPFAVDAFFDYSLVLTYAVPKEDLQPLIPACLELDTHQDQWGFVAIALVQTRNLRPTGLPAFLGQDFFLIGYRVFVRYGTNTGKRLRGLYILQSETNSRKMAVLGSMFTKYRYVMTDITCVTSGTTMTVTSHKSGLAIAVDTNPEDRSLPLSSPFSDWKVARRFAGPLPFTFSYNPETKAVLLVEGVREHWQAAPVRVLRAESAFLGSLDVQNISLANAFIIRDIPYQWKREKQRYGTGKGTF